MLLTIKVYLGGFYQGKLGERLVAAFRGAKSASLFRRGLQLTETEGPRTQNRPPEGFAGLCVTAVCRGLFSYKSPSHKPGKLNAVQLRVTQHKANFSAKHKRDLATKGFAFGNHKLLKKLDQNFFYLKVLASPAFLVMPRLSQYSKIATANLREAPIRSRISARVICPFLATCSLAISSALL